MFCNGNHAIEAVRAAKKCVQPPHPCMELPRCFGRLLDWITRSNSILEREEPDGTRAPSPTLVRHGVTATECHFACCDEAVGS